MAIRCHTGMDFHETSFDRAVRSQDWKRPAISGNDKLIKERAEIVDDYRNYDQRPAEKRPESQSKISTRIAFADCSLSISALKAARESPTKSGKGFVSPTRMQPRESLG